MRGVVEGGCRFLKIVRPRKANEAIAQVLALDQHENHEDDDQAGRGERVKERHDQASDGAERPCRRLPHLDRNRW